MIILATIIGTVEMLSLRRSDFAKLASLIVVFFVEFAVPGSRHLLRRSDFTHRGSREIKSKRNFEHEVTRDLFST